MTNYEKIVRVLEVGGRVELVQDDYSYSEGEKIKNTIVGVAENGELITDEIFEDEFELPVAETITKEELEELSNVEIKFIHNPPKMYEVGQKVLVIKKESEYYGKILEVGYNDDNFIYGFMVSDTGNASKDFIEFSHYDLEPVFN